MVLGAVGDLRQWTEHCRLSSGLPELKDLLENRAEAISS